MAKRNIIKNCRRLRKDQTDAEKVMWICLRSRQMSGVKFRRQYPVGKYILDFYAYSHKLAIELDGGQHYEDEGKKRDLGRTRYLNSEGIKVLRFPNNEVLVNMDGIYEVIMGEIEKINPSS